ncbi:MAG: hypothetical protein JST92_09040 [Deltaproteobacteria bacterium]|nr:hypothetical protein [Deltaproteobacteria bacterium]
MHSFTRALALCCAVVFAAPALADSSKVVAVLDFKSKLKGKEAEEVDPIYLANVVRSKALESGAGLKVMTRENMLVLVQAQGKTLAECEGECEVDTGRRLGADLVVSGELLKFGSKYKLDMRLHDTHDGRMVSGAQVSGKTLDELDDAMPDNVRKLFAALTPVAAPVAPPPAAATQAPAQTAASAPHQSPVTAPPPPPAPAAAAPTPSSVEAALNGSCSDNTHCFVQKQCRESAKDCFSLASAYGYGNFGITKSPEMAQMIYAYGCRTGADLNACIMAKMGTKDDDEKKDFIARARASARKGCDANNPMVCYSLEKSVEADQANVKYAHEKIASLCRDKDNVQACHYAIDSQYDAPERQWALNKMRQLCADGKDDACTFMKIYKK